MSTTSNQRIKAFKAGADLSSSQYNFMKIGTSDDEVIEATGNDKTVGILMNAPGSGERAEVAIIGGGALVELAETIEALELLTPTAAGIAEQVDAADEWCGAIAQEGGVIGDVIYVEVVGFYSSKSDA